MSWWTDIRDATESIVSSGQPFDVRGESARKKTSGIAGAANKIRNAETDLFHMATGTQTAAEKRDSARMISDQIKAYKDQTELTRQGIEEAKAQRETERRRVEEKQIRGLRNRTRAIGLMNTGEPASSASLGNSSGLPSRLGTA